VLILCSNIDFSSRPLDTFTRCFLNYCKTVVLMVIVVLLLNVSRQLCLSVLFQTECLSLKHLTASQSSLNLILNVLARLTSC